MNNYLLPVILMFFEDGAAEEAANSASVPVIIGSICIRPAIIGRVKVQGQR